MLIKKLQSLKINVSTERSIREWIEQGLGPPPLQYANGPGTQNDHHNQAYAEFYASHKCLQTKRLKPNIVSDIRKEALTTLKNPLFVKRLLKHEIESSSATGVLRWILAWTKVTQKIDDLKLIRITFRETLIQSDVETLSDEMEFLLKEVAAINIGVIIVGDEKRVILLS